MHQEHNLPWNTLASLSKYVRDDRSFTPPYTGFKSLGRPTQERDYEFFIQRLTSTIHEFAVTERKKYPPTRDLKPPSNGLLFSDELRDKYPEYLNAKNQRLDYWTSSEFKTESIYIGTYYTSSREREDVVKILIHENQMETLLMLGAHPLVPLRSLQHRCFSWIAYDAIDCYIFWNFLAATGHLTSGAYKEMEKYKYIVTENTRPKAHYVLHHEFYGGTCVLEPPLVDVSRLHEYLKRLFSLCYRCDMLMMEFGWQDDWYWSIKGSLRFTRSRHGKQRAKRETQKRERMNKEGQYSADI